MYARGLATRDGGAPRGFEACGADGVYRPAAARLEGEAVVLDGGAEGIRYGWKPYPEPAPNLVNADGLPATPFAWLPGLAASGSPASGPVPGP